MTLHDTFPLALEVRLFQREKHTLWPVSIFSGSQSWPWLNYRFPWLLSALANLPGLQNVSLLEGEIKSVLDKQNPQEFITNEPTLQEMINGFLYAVKERSEPEMRKYENWKNTPFLVLFFNCQGKAEEKGGCSLVLCHVLCSYPFCRWIA